MSRSGLTGLLQILFFLWMAVSLLDAQNTQSSCPRRWYRLYERCYLPVPSLKSFTEAVKFCNKYGATLAKPTGFTISNALAQEMNTRQITQFWAGYNRLDMDEEPDDLAQWSDGTQAFVEQGVWAPYEPNTQSGPCASIRASTGGEFLWSMGSCDLVLASLCEITPCPSNTFRCNNGICIASSKVCDRNDNCGDFSDEMHCVPDLHGFDGINEFVQIPSAGVYDSPTTRLFTIEATPGTRIRIEFVYFATEKDLDVLEIWDGGLTLGGSTLVARMSGSLPIGFEHYVSSANFLVIRFTSDSSKGKEGFKFNWYTDFQCTYWRLPGVREGQGQAGYFRSDDTRDDCENACTEDIACRGYRYDVTPERQDRACFIIIEGILPVSDSSSDVYLKTCPYLTDLPTLETVPVLPPYLQAEGTPQEIFTPLFPAYYLGNTELTHTIMATGNQLITLQVIKVDLCCTDFVNIHDGDGPTATLLATLTSTSSADVIISSGNRVYLYMYLMQHWQCSGVLLTYKQGCDIELNINTGTIKSPASGVAPYPGLVTCSWLVRSTTLNAIKLTFIDFSTEERKDFVEVYDGDSADDVALHLDSGFHGSVSPGTLVAASGAVFVRLRTSATVHLPGFRASFSTACSSLEEESVELDPGKETYHYPDSVRMTCAEGYYLGGAHKGQTTLQLSCELDGYWDVRPIPFCERGDCGKIELIGNGYVNESSGVRGGDHVTYACNQGYSLIGQETVTCQSNNTWEPRPICSGDSCANLIESWQPSDVTVVKGDGVVHGSIVRLSCPEFYQLVGPETLQCVDGDWKDSVPACKAITCAVPGIKNAVIGTGSDTTVGNTIYVECEPGYIMADGSRGKSFVCGIDDPPTCTNIDECETGTHQCVNSDCEDTNGGYLCHCHPGYQLEPGTSTTCEDIDECHQSGLAPCDDVCENSVGSYSCACSQDGYELYTAGNQALPLDFGEDGSKPWHKFQIGHSCVPDSCDASPILHIEHGNALTTKTSFFSGDEVFFLCHVAYTAFGGFQSGHTVTCLPGGMWDRVPACGLAYINELLNQNQVPLRNITYGETYRLNCTRPNGDVIVLEREAGYIALSDAYRTVGPTLECPVSDCGTPPVVPGSDEYSVPCTQFSCQFTFQCRKAYELQGNSSEGDNIVRCNNMGMWDFGDLHCVGGQCPPPPFPEDGYAVFDSVDEGSEVSYGCNREGYFPQPDGSRKCTLVGSTLVWLGRTPECTDQEKPVFDFCPTNFAVALFQEARYKEPIVSDNNGVCAMEIVPRNFQSGTAVDSPLSVHYTATDCSQNKQTCKFFISTTDKKKPVITCSSNSALSTFYVNGPFDDSVVALDTTEYYSVDELTADITVDPQTIDVNVNAIGTNPVVTYTAEDPSHNSAYCQIQFAIAAEPCSDWSLRLHNAEKQCSPKSLALGYDCEITCHADHVFFSDPTAESLSMSCFTDAEWSPQAPPICTTMQDAYFRFTTRLRFSDVGSVDTAVCEEHYRSKMESILPSLTGLLSEGCQAAVDGGINIDRPQDGDVPPVQFTIEDDGGIAVLLTLDIQPYGLADDDYQQCSNDVHGRLYFLEDQVFNQLLLDGVEDGTCPDIQPQDNSASIYSSQFVCDGPAEAKPFPPHHVCLTCPPGTYKAGSQCSPCEAGKYNDEFSQTSCTDCPSGYLPDKTGLTDVKDCYDACWYGLYSATGYAPCTGCPPDTFYVDSKTCEGCHTGHHTRGSGALSSTECIQECDPGQFSVDGLVPCTDCPRNYYQGGRGSKSCLQCNDYQITLAPGMTKITDCIDGAASLCTSTTCLNGGNCSIVLHNVSCECAPGYMGRRCEVRTGPCHSNPCLNGGTCVDIDDVNGTYACNCPEDTSPPGRYSGNRCEIDIDDCVNDPCKNNGTCIDRNGDYVCSCSSYSGFTGATCTVPVDPCPAGTCNNHGNCIAHGNFYSTCKCDDGFTGLRCEINIDECDPNPCVNGGTCIDGDNAITCICPPGYMGKYCHRRDVSFNCPINACGTQFACVDDFLNDERFCVCSHGFEYDDILGQCMPIDACASTSVECLSSGQCIAYDGAYRTKCKCGVGYAGTLCEHDIDNCIPMPCLNGGTCKDGINDYTCVCEPGTGGRNCTDSHIDCVACVADNTDTCTELINGYKCHCKAGYTGTTCDTKIPSCANYPCQHDGNCTNPDENSDDYECACPYPWGGLNCETEISYCTTGSECHNEGTCLSSSHGMTCVCPSNYIGPSCETPYDVCEVANPCREPNSACVLVNDVPECLCSAGYTGASCETLIWFCTDTTCLNGGTCSVDSSGVHCACALGYDGQNCETDIDECLSSPCPNTATCVDEVYGFRCECMTGTVGETCEKELSVDFDYIVTSPSGCINDEIPAEILLEDTTQLSVLFWTRYDKVGSPGTILTILGNNERKKRSTTNRRRRSVPSEADFEMEFFPTTVAVSLGSSTEEISYDTSVSDSLWHHIAVTFSADNGLLVLYIDGASVGQLSLGEGATLPQRSVLLLGENPVKVAEGFTAPSEIRISRLFVFNEDLSNTEVQSVKDNLVFIPESAIVSFQSSLMTFYTKDFQSQLTAGICTEATNCVSSAFKGATPPIINTTPEDTVRVSNRVSTPSWEAPTFTGTGSDVTVVESNLVPRETPMGWGIHGLFYAAYNAEGDAAVYSYRLFNMRNTCESRDTPSGLSRHCIQRNEGVCSLECVAGNYGLSEPAPRYQVCDKYRMWDTADRDVIYTYPVCSVALPLTYDLKITLLYNLQEQCNAEKIRFIRKVRETLATMNKDFQWGLCHDENGVADVECEDASITMSCVFGSVGTLEIELKYVEESVRDASSVAFNLRELLLVAIGDNAEFTYKDDTVDAQPELSTLSIELTAACKSNYQVVGDRCVKCGSGTYYDASTLTCVRCPRGTFGDGTGTTCTSCQGREKTNDIGSSSIDQCHKSCFSGKAFSIAADDCVLCPQGFYTSELGSFVCLPCAIEFTTQENGTTSQDQCIPWSETTTTSTGTGGPPPGVGASTLEETGLSVGEIVAVVLAVLVTAAAIVFILLFCFKNQLPCFDDETKVGPAAPTPWKHVNKYGDTNIRFVSYKLSDIKEGKKQIQDSLPITITQAPPSLESMSMRTDFSVHVPIFVEILDRKVRKKSSLLSKTRSYESLDADQDSEALSTVTPTPTLTPPRSLRSQRRMRTGRPPAELPPNYALTSTPLPRALAPIPRKLQSQSLPPSEINIRPFSGLGRAKPEVKKNQYQDFLQRRPVHQKAKSDISIVSKVSRITVDSDEEDYR